MSPLKVFIGYDSREPKTYDVAEASLLKHASVPVSITPLKINRLADCGLLRRATDLRGQRYDIPSNAPASTEFAISRFLVPLLAQTGWALFIDADVVFLDDIAKLFELADSSKAMMVVKHGQLASNSPKMDSQPQLVYGRKNWSSVILWNCDHPANKRLSLSDIQERKGLDLHQFYWLHDDEIGELPATWNWLVNVQAQPDFAKLAHFTLGTPEIGVDSPYDYLWYQAQP